MDYRIRLVQTVYEEAWVAVKANDIEAAERKAVKLAASCDLDWRFYECGGDVEVATITEEPVP